MKHKIIVIGVFMAWIFVVICALSSCNVSKHINKTSTDSTSVVKKDSANSSIANLSKSDGSTTSDSSSLDIELYNPLQNDTPNVQTGDIEQPKLNPAKGSSVHITPKKDGGFDIESNTPIKSIKTKSSKTTEQHKTTDSSNVKVNTIHTSDSSHLVKDVKTVDKVSKSAISFFDWIAIVIGGIVVVYIAAAIYLKANPLAWILGFVRKKTGEV